jgi:tetratricopeptide (TPR) repeat protein
MPDASAATLEEGKNLFNTRHYDDAIDTLRQILKQDPACSGAHHYLGRSLLEINLRNEAIREFSEAIRTNPSDGNSRYWLGQILLENGSVADARALLYEAIRLEPWLLHHFIEAVAASLRKQCTFAETEEFFRNAAAILAAVPLSGPARGDLSRSRARLLATLGELYFSKGLLNGAMLQYREAAALCPKEPSFHARLADIYFVTNNDDDSVAEYHAAIAHDPENAEYHKRLGDALVKTRQFIDAFNEYREAARLAPENEFYKKVYSQFRTLFIDSSAGGAPGPGSEKHPPLPVTPSIADETFLALIRGGENEFVEFKSSALWSKNLSKADIAASESRDLHKYGRDTSKVVIAKTIAGFLNTEGGNLIIGIREDKGGGRNGILGIEKEYPRLRDPCTDGYRRMLIDEIIRKYLPPEIYHHLGRYLRIHFMNAEGRTLCWLEIKRADDVVFVKIQDDEIFYIRIDAETRQIADRALVDYVRKRFP